MTYQEELEQANSDLHKTIKEINQDIKDYTQARTIEELQKQLAELNQKIKFKDLMIEIFSIHYQQMLLLSNKKYGAKYFILELESYISEVEQQAKLITDGSITRELLLLTIEKSYSDFSKEVKNV